MTSNEFYKLAVDLTAHNPRINKIQRNLFLKRLKEVPGAIEEAMALFGDRGVYYADMKDLGQFVADTTKITAKGINKEKYQDYTKYSTNFKTNN